MTAAFFYAVIAVASLLAIAAELVYARRTGRRWHAPADTAGNLNLGTGNVVLAAATAGVVVAGYSALRSMRIADVPSMLPASASLALAILFADFLQYWNHRLSHKWNLLWWGHITHHSSSQMNLSTGIRVNWVYRSYAWVLYAPMPLLGFSVESFVIAQTVINLYNLFMHTRWDIPFGRLGAVLVTPMSHRLHHSADPKYFGNYGAMLIIWDRLFGTYRALQNPREELTFGVARNVDSSNPIRLNFDYLRELWQTARSERRSFLSLLLSTDTLPASEPRQISGPVPAGRRMGADVSRAAWVSLLLVAAVAHTVNHAQGGMPLAGRAVALGGALLLVIAFGVLLERHARRRG